MNSINVVVHGVLGKMGAEVANAICNSVGLVLVGVADRRAKSNTYELPDGSGIVPMSDSLEEVIQSSRVVVDFSSAEGAMDVVRTAANHKVNVVVGSTGLTEDNLQEIDRLSQEYSVGIILAPNFAVGAVLMMHAAKMVAPFFDYVELTEVHHEAKIDAPSGTALAMARAVVDGKGEEFKAPKVEKEILPGTRGGVYKGVSIHSGRMPGRTAHHELVFGALGQTLTLRHDSINRESFMPGVIMAVREVVKSPGLQIGLDKVMGL